MKETEDLILFAQGVQNFSLQKSALNFHSAERKLKRSRKKSDLFFLFPPIALVQQSASWHDISWECNIGRIFFPSVSCKIRGNFVGAAQQIIISRQSVWKQIRNDALFEGAVFYLLRYVDYLKSELRVLRKFVLNYITAIHLLQQNRFVRLLLSAIMLRGTTKLDPIKITL